MTAREAGYRPFLDGLRAVAVYLVLLFHAGSPWFSGGFIGVDVFFVLSGYLVTQLLMRDLDAAASIRFGRFYARRFRRLLPAALVALTVTAVVFAAIASPVEVADAADGFTAAFLYATNWYFIHQSASYFGGDLSGNPLLHVWSLAVEEQFYLLWPLLLGGLFALARRAATRSTTIMRGAIAVGASASLGLAWTLRGSDPNHAYYGTDARAYQLLAGALLALSPGVARWLGRRARGSAWLSSVALALLVGAALQVVDLDPIQRGIVVTVITTVLIASLEATGGAAAGRLLSVEPLVYLGKISYGTYLWHWPVIVVIARSFDMSTLSTVGLTALVATGLASLSFHLIEHPVRASRVLDQHRRPVIAAGLVTSVLAGLVLAPALTTADPSSSAVSGESIATVGFTPVPTGISWDAVRKDRPPFRTCLDQPVAACTVRRGSGAHILLIGDSHAAMVIPALEALASAHDLTLSVSAQAGCPWQRNLYAPAILSSEADCRRARDDLYDRVVPALHPDVVVVMNLGYEQPGQKIIYFGPARQALPNGRPSTDAWLEQTTVDSLDQLRADGASVVVLEPTPYDVTGADPLACLSAATVVEECRTVVRTTPTGLELLYRRLAEEHDDVWTLDLDRLVCPYLPICDPILDGKVVKLDSNHLTATFARTLGPALDRYFTQQGILPR